MHQLMTSIVKLVPCFNIDMLRIWRKQVKQKRKHVTFYVASCRCIGSIQHLKGKFGRGYSLEINLREELTGLQEVALLHKEILKIFPHAARQDR